MSAPSGIRVGVRVWDIPTRLFHWLLVALFAFSWWNAENRHMDWHYISGLTLLGLLAFRLIWGLVGASTARLGPLFASPGTVLDYLKGRQAARAGHNPLGGYSVLVMLVLLSLQVGTGLFATDVDGLESGPLSFLVSFEQGRLAAEVHAISFNVLLALIGLHVLAVGFYQLFRRRNLLGPMVTGRDRELAPETPAVRPASLATFAIAATVAAAFAWYAGKGFGL
ncbi:cytochrome b/b6 domain-containing protein [Novosphingobium sp. BL-8H]|uniref:cytochrome b/b6 domain-containing protein n=1 Tax=Novosphingobium sp. BL-8H TaxID=3127640 RepID=UPI0037583ABE